MDKNDICNNLDPRELQQGFAQVDLRILCMHYWWLEVWRYKNLALPFWRIYWNDREGAEIIHEGRVIPLKSSHIAVISPNTEYSSRLNTDLNTAGAADRLYGGPTVGNILNITTGTRPLNRNALNHFFIHFTLGVSNVVLPHGVFVLELTAEQKQCIREMISFGTDSPGVFTLRECLVINSFISGALAQISQKEWGTENLIDERIHNALLTIEKSAGRIPSNTELADAAFLSKDAFIRVFRKEMGMSPHQYILKHKIQEAAMQLLHNKALGIEEVARDCGFEDRNYFTRIFTKVIGLPPARYRRLYSIGRD